MIHMTLPYPPSANRYWRNGKHGTYVSEEAKAFKQTVAQIGMVERVPMVEGPVSLTVHVFRPQKSGDLMNREKVLSDSLQGVVYKDDKQIVEAHFYLHDDSKNPRAEVSIALVEAK